MALDDGIKIDRRRFLQALAAVGVATACGPAAPPAVASPAASATGTATAKPVSIEWWRRNYTAGTQSAETVTSDGAVKGFRAKNPNFTISIQGGPFGPETDQKFDIAILQQKAGPDVFHTTGGDVLKYAAAGQLSEPPLTAAEKADFNASALTATTYKGKVVAYPLWIVPWFEYINLDLFKERGVTPPRTATGRTRSSSTPRRSSPSSGPTASRSTASPTRTTSSRSCSSTVAASTTP